MSLIFYSTNLGGGDATLRDALLKGQAGDKGLFMPRTIPRLPRAEILGFKEKSYAEVAFAVLKRYTENMIPDDELMKLCQECYDYPVPLEKVFDRNFVMRLDQGPTASFKDFAARMMARMMRYFLNDEDSDLVILTATSGDTGSAVAHAFHNVDRIRVVVLFPKAEVSDRQRKQMTTLGGNVTVVGIDGKFDDCQALVKQAFGDFSLRSIRLSSANSINIGRLLPQSVYYFYAYAKLQEKGENCVFSIPSGNFGDMCGGMLAWRMGLPMDKAIIATNANDEFPKFVKAGMYRKLEPSLVCISNAMNVGHPSNLPRLVALYGGQMDEAGKVIKYPDLAAMQRELFTVSISDDETRKTIADAWQQHKVMLEPHGAVGWAALLTFLSKGYRPGLAISIETAHPAKFPEEIKKLLGIEPELPTSLAGLDAKPESFEEGSNDYAWFRDFLVKRFSGNAE